MNELSNRGIVRSLKHWNLISISCTFVRLSLSIFTWVAKKIWSSSSSNILIRFSSDFCNLSYFWFCRALDATRQYCFESLLLYSGSFKFKLWQGVGVPILRRAESLLRLPALRRALSCHSFSKHGGDWLRLEGVRVERWRLGWFLSAHSTKPRLKVLFFFKLHSHLKMGLD